MTTNRKDSPMRENDNPDNPYLRVGPGPFPLSIHSNVFPDRAPIERQPQKPEWRQVLKAMWEGFRAR